MAKDIDSELADIMGAYRARTTEKQQKAAEADREHGRDVPAPFAEQDGDRKQPAHREDPPGE